MYGRSVCLLPVVFVVLCVAFMVSGQDLICKDSRQFGDTFVFQLSLSLRTVCYNLNWTAENEAVRVFVESEGATVQHPVLVTVRQPKGVMSWSIPKVESGFAYPSVVQTLCPLLNTNESGERRLFVDLSSSSTSSLNVTLRVTTLSNFKMQLNNPVPLIASPSKPSFLLFEYPPDLTKVRVKVTSMDETSGICAIASVQNVYCPEVELFDHPDSRGTYQTLTTTASIDALARGYNFGFFYIVVTVFPNNGLEGNCDFTRCGFKEVVTLNDNAHNYDPLPYTGSERIKRVNVTVEPTLSDTGYYGAMAVIFVLLSLFYVVAIAWIIIFDWWRYDCHPMYSVLKRGESIYTEERFISPNNMSPKYIDESVSTEDTDADKETFKGTEILIADKIPKQLTSMSNIDTHGLKDKLTDDTVTLSRPPFLSVMVGIHWKRALKKHKSRKFPSESLIQLSPKYIATQSLTTSTSALEVQPLTSLQTPYDVQSTSSSGVRHRQLKSTEVLSESRPAIAIQSIRDPARQEREEKKRAELVGPHVLNTENKPLQQYNGVDYSTVKENCERSLADERDVAVEISKGYECDTPCFPVNVYLSELGEIDECQKALDFYPLYLLLVGIFYAIPAFQSVLTYRWLTATGNEDICYFNSLCSHRWDLSNGLTIHAFNNVYSNIVFFSLGFLLILITFRRRQMYQFYVERNQTRIPEQRFGVPQQFGIFYGIGVAMMAQAIMSTAYHMCPTRDNFRFDSTFMYVQTGLGIHKLLQSRCPDKNPDVFKIMLILSATVIAVVVGMVESVSRLFWAVFFVIQMMSIIVITFQVYYRGQLTHRSIKKLFAMYWNDGIFPPKHVPKFVLSVVSLVINTAFALAGIAFQPSKFGSLVLYIFLANLMMYLIYYIVAKRVFMELEKIPLKVVGFSLLSFGCWALGLYFYLLDPTEWNLSPAISREKNLECMLFSFYDSHDIWHFLSGFGVFFTALLLMTLDDNQEVWFRKHLVAF